jgi:radical SAM enzyme (TIGR01210 family)
MSEPDLPEINDRWILELRGHKNLVDPFRPGAFLAEEELTPEGRIEKVNTIFLTNMECRFTCLMCDLWKNTTDRITPPGAIPEQIEWALEQMPTASHIKLYNSANFFDSRSIPPADYHRIAELVESYETVIVENHPNLTGERVLQFARMIKPGLQVAMGLESVHPGGLKQLNKKMTPGDFRKAVWFLKENGIDSRAFIMLRPPFLNEQEGIYWAIETIKYALDSGTNCCTVIPARAGNGAMDCLQSEGLFHPPEIASLESVQESGIGLGKGLIFADTWDLHLFSHCDHCFEVRKDRIDYMNLTQKIPPPVSCNCSPGNSPSGVQLSLRNEYGTRYHKTT